MGVVVVVEAGEPWRTVRAEPVDGEDLDDAPGKTHPGDEDHPLDGLGDAPRLGRHAGLLGEGVEAAEGLGGSVGVDGQKRARHQITRTHPEVGRWPRPACCRWVPREVAEALRRKAYEEHRSEAAIIREGLHRVLGRGGKDR